MFCSAEHNNMQIPFFFLTLIGLFIQTLNIISLACSVLMNLLCFLLLQDQLMAQNRLIKLQKLNRKQLRSPICPSLKDPNKNVNTSPTIPPDKNDTSQEAAESPG